MGHSSTKAAMIYLHTVKDRDRAITDALGEIIRKGLKSKEGDGDDLPLVEVKIN